jgi:hypothetical protein
VAELADLLRGVADGTPPAIDSDLTVVPPPDERSVGVLAFPGQHIIVAEVAAEWVRSWLPQDDLGPPLGPPFLTLLAAVTGREIGTVDAVLVAKGHGRRRGQELTEVTNSDHPRLVRARRARTEVRAWSCPGGLLVLGKGVAGRWEVAVEVDATLRGFGLGRGLFAAALGLVPAGEPVWAQVAPGNAASLRALLGVGYRPVGAEVLLGTRAEDDDGEPIEWFGSYDPELDWATDEPIGEPTGEPISEAIDQAASEPRDDATDRPTDHAGARHAAEQAPVAAEQAPVEQAPVEQAPVEQTPVEQTPVERAPAEQAPASPGPVERAPIESRLVESRSAEPIESSVAEAAPRPMTSVAPTPATAAEIAAAEAEAEGELAADEDTELAEHDDPHS